MNKQEKFAVLLLGLCLVGWIWHSVNEQRKAAEAARETRIALFSWGDWIFARNVLYYIR